MTIAVADALSDAMGIHLAEESKNNGSEREIWEATLATFAAKFVIAMSFVLPVILLPLDQAVLASIGWGLSLLTLLSYGLAKAQRIAPWKVIAEHGAIALLVVAATHFLGEWIRRTLG
jgi:VIT1/CCC1 family predicted Fe2+/Mn2+ transporter